MRRAHRIVHRAVWPVLAVLVLLGLAAALWLRPKPVISDQEPVTRTRVFWSLVTDYRSLIGHWS